LGVKTTQFDLSDAKKKKLEESGAKGATAYLKWFDGATSAPFNRP
jgi:hypothetical protein